jgi:hypothetical protein
MKDEALKLALEAAYLAGFNASGEGYNGEYGIDCPEENAIWKKDRDNELTAIKQALAAQPPVQPVAFLANGTRFKISYDSRQSGGQIHGIPPELGGRWVAFVAAEDDCHLKLATPPAQPAVQEPVALHAMAKRRVFDAIRGAYDLGYNDARSARAVHGDSAPGYKGRDVEADHGGALFSALVRYTTPPAAQPAPVQEPDAMGCKCSECGDWQRWTPSGMVCKNGHGGASGINQRLYTTPPAAQPAVPDALNPKDENPAYAAGWNDCRQAMLEMMK